MSPNRVIRKKIGELLIERGIITEEQLNIALQEQKRKGGYISQHFISLGFATEFDIAICLANQYDFAYLPLKNYNIPDDVLETVPLKLIKIYSILPIDKIGKVLTVAMADPLNDGVIDMLKQITNCEIEVFISTYSELNQTINKYFGQRLKIIDKNIIDEEDLLKEGIAEPFIQTTSYAGRERRRYKRMDVELEMSYFLQGKIFQTKIKNISYVGIFFVSEVSIPLSTDIFCKINLKEIPIDTVIQIVRVEKLREIRKVDSYEVSVENFGIAGFFNFITDEDKKKLIAFLKEKLSCNPEST